MHERHEPPLTILYRDAHLIAIDKPPGLLVHRSNIDRHETRFAIQILRERKSDLVLSDMAMKPMDGLEFTRHVRNSEQSPNPFVPIIMITGHTERHRVEAARDAGVTEFLAKPITAAHLFSRIAEIVERPRAFVRCESYFGPDRRRRQIDDYAGPWRRAEDFQDMDVR